MTDKKLDTAELFTLADALQMELTVTGVDQIDGHVNENIEAPALGLKFPFKLIVQSSRVEWQDGKVLDKALLISVDGDLAMLALHETGEKMVHIGLIDMTKMTAKLRTGKHPLSGFFEERASAKLAVLIDNAFKPAIVTSFERGDFNAKWNHKSSLLHPQKAA